MHKKNSKSYVIKRLQIKTPMNYNYRPVYWPNSGRLTAQRADEDVEWQGISFIAGGNKNGETILEDVWFFKKLIIL